MHDDLPIRIGSQRLPGCSFTCIYRRLYKKSVRVGEKGIVVYIFHSYKPGQDHEVEELRKQKSIKATLVLIR